MVGEDNNSSNTSNIRHVLLNNASGTVISDITPPLPSTPGVNATRINIGQHPTPEIVHLTVNEDAYETGYDSDGQMGTFFDVVRGESQLIHQSMLRKKKKKKTTRMIGDLPAQMR